MQSETHGNRKEASHYMRLCMGLVVCVALAISYQLNPVLRFCVFSLHLHLQRLYHLIKPFVGFVNQSYQPTLVHRIVALSSHRWCT